MEKTIKDFDGSRNELTPISSTINCSPERQTCIQTPAWFANFNGGLSLLDHRFVRYARIISLVYSLKNFL
jgi:hypothetical protein